MTPPDTLRLKVLDVGEGDAIILHLPSCHRAVLIDAFDGERVLEVLEEEQVEELVVFVTHSDNDHIKGVQHILDNFNGEFLAFFYNRDRLKDSLKRYRANLSALAPFSAPLCQRLPYAICP